MTDTAKPDLSREAVERLAKCTVWKASAASAAETAATLRALLDAKEAAERAIYLMGCERDNLADNVDRLHWECVAAFAAKEAAEKLHDADQKTLETYRAAQRNVLAALTEARAANAAAWEAANIIRDALREVQNRNKARLGLVDAKTQGICQRALRSAAIRPDPSATEALRRVKAEVWEAALVAADDHAASTFAANAPMDFRAIPNPYATEARHD